jgi:lysophospholipase L1-like esterase
MQDCIRRLDVMNRGFSGWNTANAVSHFDQIFPAPTSSSPKIAFLVCLAVSISLHTLHGMLTKSRQLILLGANDAVLPLEHTAQHIPLDQYKRNLGDIVNHPHIKAHQPKILLVTPPPLDEIKTSKLDIEKGFPQSTRTSSVSASYSEAAREVARENPGIVLVDLWKAVMDKAIEMSPSDYQSGGPWLGSPENGKSGGLDILLPDGLHMNGDAYRILYGLIAPHIGAHWTGNPENDRAEYVLPDWRDINVPIGGRIL